MGNISIGKVSSLSECFDKNLNWDIEKYFAYINFSSSETERRQTSKKRRRHDNDDESDDDYHYELRPLIEKETSSIHSTRS